MDRSDDRFTPIKTIENMKTPLHIAAGIFAIGLCACSQNDPQEARERMNNQFDKVEDKMNDATNTADTRKEWVEDRNDILDDLRDLRNKIESELASHNEALAGKDLKANDRREHETMKAELEKEKGIVDGLIKNVDGATDSNWETVKADTRTASKEVKDWWNRMKENIDRKTDADNDNDGH